MSRPVRAAIQEIEANPTHWRRFRPYPAYRDLAVEWLGRVPTNWTVDRLKWTVVACRNGTWGSEPDGIDDIVCVRVADFDRTAFRVSLSNPTFRAITHSERNGRLLCKGDLLIEKSGGGELQPVGAVVHFDHDIPAVSSNFIARMPVRKGFDARFLAYSHAHLYTSRVNSRSIKQTTGIQNLDSMAYLSELATWAPLQEQRTIAAFLDRETARIDALVAKKTRLIELLQEKRAALISHAVTKGLNPNAPMKPSGINWLPEIPKHWHIRPLKFFSNLRPRSFTDGDWIETPYVTYEGIRLIQCGNIGTGVYEEQGFRCISEDTFRELGCTAVRPGDVLICRMRSSPRILAGRACQAPSLGDRMVTAVDNCIVKCAHDVDPRFLVYQLSSRAYLEHIEVVARGGTRDRISRSMLGSIRLVSPPLEEQQAIANHLDAETSMLDGLVSKVEQAIDKLHEYRSALISAAVTGKIDVREEVAA